MVNVVFLYNILIAVGLSNSASMEGKNQADSLGRDDG